MASALALGAASIAGQAPPQKARGAALSGVVVDAVTGRPVAGAVVALSRLDGGPSVPSMVTDRQGRFVFLDLPASDSYYLGARRFGYTYTRYGWTAPGGSLAIRDIARISLSEGQWLSTIRIPLWRLGAIEGRVSDERGEPVVGVAVRAFAARRVAGRQQLVGGPIVTTDDRGTYRMVGLDPGRYVLGVLSVQSTVLETTPESPQLRPVGALASGGIGAGRGASVSSPTIDIDGRHRLALTNFATPPPPASGQGRAYPAMFHPASATITGATAIEVDYGDRRTGVDFQLYPAPAFRVSGRVNSPLGPAPSFLLRLLPIGAEQLGFGAEAATTVVEPDGRFTFLNVPAGDYTIVAQASVMDFTSGSPNVRFDDAPGFPGGGISVGSMTGAPGLGYLTRSGQPSPVWGRAAVSVGRLDVDDVIVSLQATVTVNGRIVLSEGTQLPASGRLSVTAQPANGDPALGQPGGSTRPDDATRAFSIPGLMGGRYVLRSFNGLGVVSVVWNERDVTDSGLDASAGRDFDGVVVTLTDRHATVSGTVGGSPVATAAVIAFPVQRELWVDYGWEPLRLRAARTSSSGAFQIESLPKGEYYVIAVDAARINSWSDPAFLAAAAPVATRVSLDWGDKSTLGLTYREVTAP